MEEFISETRDERIKACFLMIEQILLENGRG